MLVKTFGSAVFGIEALAITIEVNISAGTQYYMVGLPDNAVKESLHRVESAIHSAGFRMPRQKIVVNLAPADLRKEGSAYDLAIAIGILAASGQIQSEQLSNYLLMGELSLDGTVQARKGVNMGQRYDTILAFIIARMRHVYYVFKKSSRKISNLDEG